MVFLTSTNRLISIVCRNIARQRNDLTDHQQAVVYDRQLAIMLTTLSESLRNSGIDFIGPTRNYKQEC